MLEEAPCKREIQPGKRPAARLPKIPIAIPEEQMKLNPRARLFSVVTEATAGARATGQTDEIRPATAAKAEQDRRRKSPRREEPEIPAVRANDAIRVL